MDGSLIVASTVAQSLVMKDHVQIVTKLLTKNVIAPKPKGAFRALKKHPTPSNTLVRPLVIKLFHVVTTPVKLNVILDHANPVNPLQP